MEELMTGVRNVVLFCAVAVSMLGCGGTGKDSAEPRAESSSKATDAMAQEAQGGAEAMAKALSTMANGLSGGDPNQKPVDPVSFRELQSVFPEQFPGWERGRPTGEKMSSPVSYSEAGVSFTRNDSELDLKVTDTGFNQLLLMPFAVLMNAGYEKETDDGYEKSTKVGGFPGWTKWNSTDKNGELNVLVGNRFLVQIEGRRLSDTSAMQQLATAMNLNKLAGLR
jgi:hypothetical protein